MLAFVPSVGINLPPLQKYVEDSIMKILGINSSPRGSQSQTVKLVEAVLGGAKDAGAEIELVDICKLKIEYCKACTVCYKTGECIYKDDFNEIYNKILNCDGLILGSPVYFHSVTAQLKTLIDRMSDAVHCQLLHGKYACAVSTTAASALDVVIEYMNQIMVAMGANSVGGAGAVMSLHNSMEDAEKEAFKLGHTLVEAIENKTIYIEQEEVHKMVRDMFGNLIDMNKNEWTHEYEHWVTMGWLDEVNK